MHEENIPAHECTFYNSGGGEGGGEGYCTTILPPKRHAYLYETDRILNPEENEAASEVGYPILVCVCNIQSTSHTYSCVRKYHIIYEIEYKKQTKQQKGGNDEISGKQINEEYNESINCVHLIHLRTSTVSPTSC